MTCILFLLKLLNFSEFYLINLSDVFSEASVIFMLILRPKQSYFIHRPILCY